MPEVSGVDARTLSDSNIVSTVSREEFERINAENAQVLRELRDFMSKAPPANAWASALRWLLGGGIGAIFVIVVWVFNLGQDYADLKNQIRTVEVKIDTLVERYDEKLASLQTKADENDARITVRLAEDRKTIKSIEEKLMSLQKDVAVIKAKLEDK